MTSDQPMGSVAGFMRDGGYQDQYEAPEGIDLWALGGRIWARRGLILGFVVFGVALTFAALQVVTPTYTGEVRILIEGRATESAIPLSPQSVTEADEAKVASEIQVILSRSLAEQVIAKLKLASWDEFKARSSGGGIAGAIKALFGPPPNTSRASVLSAYFDRLNVYQVAGTRVIAIDFWAEHPESAKLIANTIADVYLADKLEAKVTDSRVASSWLDEQVEKLRAKVSESEAAVEDYRRKSGLIQTDGNLLKATELSELNTQLILASADRAEVEARLKAARELLNSPNAIESAPDVLSSSLVQQLREQEVALKREITELSADLLPQHPDMQARQAELKDLQAAISHEVDKIVRKLENEARVAQAREAQLRRSIDRLKSEVSSAKMREANLAALEREASANRELLESFLLRASEAGARDDRTIQRADARIISRAEAPESPSFPKKGPMLMMAGMASFTLGLLVVLATEMAAGVRDRRASFETHSPSSPSRLEPAPPLETFRATPASHVPQQPSFGMSGWQQPGTPQPVGAYGGGYQGYAQQDYPAAHTYAAAPAHPVVPVVARIPAATGMAQQDQWAAASAAEQLHMFINRTPATFGGHVVRVAGSDDDVMGVARLLASRGLRVVALGAYGDPRWVGLSDVLSRRAGFEHVTMTDSYSQAVSIGWGTVAMPNDAHSVMQGLAALAHVYDVVLVGEPGGVATGWAQVFDQAADMALVLDRGQGVSPAAMPQVATRGIVQAGV